MRPLASLLATAVAVITAFVMPAYAGAAPAYVEVAQAGADTLKAADEDGQVCVLIAPQESAPSSCAETDAGVVTVSGALPGQPKHVGAAVPATAASIEVRRAGALLASGATVAGEAYRGVRAGSLRFALVRLLDTAPLGGLRVHALDAAGKLVAVLAPRDSELVTGHRRLLSGRSAQVRWTLDTQQEAELAPSVLDIGRETVSQCVRARVQRANVSVSNQSCASETPLDPLAFFNHAESSQIEGCDGFRLLYGVVPDAIARVSALLGNGRSRTVGTVPIGDGRRTYAVATGAVAVRAVKLVTAAGSARTLRRGLPPLAVQCADDDDGFSIGSMTSLGVDELPVIATGPAAAPAGPAAFRVADGPAGSLCMAVGDRPFRLGGCGVVSPWLGELVAAVDSYADPHALVLAVPERVAAVRISSADRKVVRTIPTTAADGYAGAHAGHVRFAATTFASVSELERVEPLDATGAILWHGAEIDDGFLLGFSGAVLGSPRRVAGRAGRPSLWQTRGSLLGRVGQCYTLTDGRRPDHGDECENDSDGPTVLLDASCRTHRLTVAVVAPAATRVLADVGTSGRRRLRLRNGRALLTLAPASPLRALTFIRNGRVRRLQISAPPAARQCGWSAVRSFE
jgi:hypothetical protein